MRSYLPVRLPFVIGRKHRRLTFPINSGLYETYAAGFEVQTLFKTNLPTFLSSSGEMYEREEVGLTLPVTKSPAQIYSNRWASSNHTLSWPAVAINNSSVELTCKDKRNLCSFWFSSRSQWPVTVPEGVPAQVACAHRRCFPTKWRKEAPAKWMKTIIRGTKALAIKVAKLWGGGGCRSQSRPLTESSTMEHSPSTLFLRPISSRSRGSFDQRLGLLEPSCLFTSTVICPVRRSLEKPVSWLVPDRCFGQVNPAVDVDDDGARQMAPCSGLHRRRW